jgi:hypothetical protein
MNFHQGRAVSIAMAAITIQLAGLGRVAGEDRPAVGPGGGRPGLVVIYDSSNSMWSPMPAFGSATGAEGRRYGVAKRFTSGLIDRLAPTAGDTDAGVLLFGSKRASDCLDRTLEVPLRPLAKGRQANEIKDAIDRASPLGMTPIAGSIKDAAQMLEGRARATIILVSDGIEECSADPCEVAAEIKRSNAKFVVHVVGIAVSSSIFGRVACMAEVTGGVATIIENPADLGNAVDIVFDAVKPPVIPVTRILATAQVRTTETFSGPFLPPSIRISGPSIAAGQAQEKRGTLTATVEPGDYRIEFRFGDETSSRDINVTSDAELIAADYVFEPGILTVHPLLEDGTPVEGQPQILWQIERVPGVESASSSISAVSYQAPELRIFVPPGKYRVTARLEGQIWDVAPQPLTVRSGAESSYSFEMK